MAADQKKNKSKRSPNFEGSGSVREIEVHPVHVLVTSCHVCELHCLKVKNHYIADP